MRKNNIVKITGQPECKPGFRDTDHRRRNDSQKLTVCVILLEFLIRPAGGVTFLCSL